MSGSGWLDVSRRVAAERPVTPIGHVFQRVRVAADPQWIAAVEQTPAPATATATAPASAAAPAPAAAAASEAPVVVNNDAAEVALRESLERERAEMAKTLESYRAAIKRLDAAAKQLQPTTAAAPETIELAMGIAREVLGRELSVDGAALRSRIDDALVAVGDDPTVKLRVAPEDLPFLGSVDLEVVEDPTLSPGALLVESERRVIDVSLETRLASIRSALEDLLARPKSEGSDVE